MNGTSFDSRLLTTFTSLADTLVDDYDVVELLQTLVDACRDVLGVTAAGILLADETGELELVASTSEASHLVEVFQLSAQSGPCIDCFRTGSPILVPSLATASGWDSFRVEALAQGFASIHALPLRLREQTIGTLNLMSSQEGPLSDEVLVAARALADVATIGILHERSFRESELLAEQLRIALSSRVVIEQAKGVVSFTADLPIDQAFERIRAYARHHQLPLSQVAGRIVRRELHFDADSER